MSNAPMKRFSLAFGCVVCVLTLAWIIHSGSGQVATEVKDSVKAQADYVDEFGTDGEKAKASVAPPRQAMSDHGADSVNSAEE